MNWMRWTMTTAFAGSLLAAAGCTLVYYEPRPARVVYAPAPAPAPAPEDAPEAPPAPVSPGYSWGQPEPRLVVVPGTEIRYVDIPDDDIFFFSNVWYRFWSGHWYYCSRYGGVWVRLAARPSFVVHIPHTHVRYRVVSPPPAWHWGRPSPRLVIIAGTDIRYVADTDDDIFFFSGLWYRWDGHFWFSCRTYGGSWIRLAARPTFVPRIPATHAKYHVVRGEPPRSHSVVKPAEPRPRPGEPVKPHPVVKPPEHGRPGEPVKPREVHKVEVRPVPAPPDRGRPDEHRGPDREPPKARNEHEERREEKAPEKPRAREEERERHEERKLPEPPRGREEERERREPKGPEPPRTRNEEPNRREPVKAPEKPKSRVEEPERRETRPVPKPPTAPEKPKTDNSKSRGRDETKSRRPEDESDDTEGSGTDGRDQGKSKGRGGR